MAAKEILRRLLLLVGLFAGLWLVFWSQSGLLRVEPVDWQAELRREQWWAEDAKRLLAPEVGEEPLAGVDLAPETRGDLASYIAHETEGRQVVVSGAEWEGLFNAVAATVLGRPPSSGWAARAAHGLLEGNLYFHVSEPPLSQVAGRFGEPGDFLYIKIEGAQRAEYLGVSLSRIEDAVRYAPGHLAFPYRHAGLWLLAATLLAYALIPWPRPPKEGLYYGRIQLLDGLGCALAAVFFALPILIANENAAGASPFGEGWAILTAVLWGLALLAASITAIAAWYGVLSLELTPDGLVHRSLTRRRAHGLDEVTGVDVIAQQLPRRLRWMLGGAALFNWRTAGQAAALSVPHYALRFTLRDGSAYTFPREGLHGIAPMVGCLRAKGAQVAPEVYELVELEPTDPAFAGPFPQPKRNVVGIIALILLLGGLAWGLNATRVPQVAAVQPGAFGAQPFALPVADERVVTPEMLAAEQAILDEMAQLSERLQEIEKELPTANAEQRQALVEESERILARVQALQEEFDRVSGP